MGARRVHPLVCRPDCPGPETVAALIDRYFAANFLERNALLQARRTVDFLTQASAEELSNYSIPGLTILSARLQADGKSVVLSTSPQAQGQTYTITINNIRDRAATPNTI